MSRSRDIADLGQDKTTLASYVDTGVTSTDLERIDITTEGTTENSKVVTTDTSGHVTLAGELRGPATLVIDPAVVGNNTGLLQVKGNLQVDGTTTTINSETLTVDDKNIVLASGAVGGANADGAGITIDGASATMTYTHSTTSFDFNKPVNVTGALTTSENVGIGTASPSSFDSAGNQLVVGSGTGHQGLTINSGSSNTGVIHFADGTTGNESYRGYIYYPHNTDKMEFGTAASTRITIDSSGNVGIGASPSDQGTGRTHLHIHSSSTDYSYISLTNNTSGSDATANGTNILSDANNFKILNRESGGHIALQTTGAGKTGIGVGSFTPTELVEVQQSTAGTQTTFKIDNEDNTNSASHSALMIATGGSSAGDPMVIFNNRNTNWSMGMDNSDSDKFVIANSYADLSSNPRITMTEAGKVGIGTTAPLTDLHVSNSGNAYFSMESPVAGGRRWEWRSANDGYLTLASKDNVIGNPSDGTTDNVFKISKDGKVGIGVDPTYPLTIAPTATGAIPTNQLIQQSDSNRVTIWNQSNSATYSALGLETRASGASAWLIANEWKSQYLGDLVFRNRNGGTTSAERMRIDSAGNVDIGGASHAARKFSIKATVSDNSQNVIECLDSGNSGIFKIVADGDYYHSGSSLSDKDLKENIINVVDGSLEKIKLLKPKSYNFKESEGFPTNKKHGFIAQEVAEVFGTNEGIATGTDGKKNMGVCYNGVLAHVVKAIQELSAKVTALENA